MLRLLKSLYYLLFSKKAYTANVSTAAYFDEMIKISLTGCGDGNADCNMYK